MAWRIGDILNFDAQLAWVRDASFQSFSFHASAGVAGHWCGIDPTTADRAQRKRLREQLAAFSMCEVHAPFETRFTLQDPLAAVARLAPIVEFAGDVGASIVTIHPQPPDKMSEEQGSACQGALARLDELAGNAGVVVGIETLADFVDFGWLRATGLRNLGVTLDIGHLYLNRDTIHRPDQSTDGLVHSLAEIMVHAHVHDYDGTYDHIELGTGLIDVPALLRAAARAHYRGGFCLEMNPDRVSPQGILRSRDLLQHQMGLLTGAPGLVSQQVHADDR